MTMPSLPRLALALITATWLTSAAAEPPRPLQVLTSLPVTYGLATTLLQDSGIEVISAVPANLPASRQPSYFSGRGAAQLERLAPQADAVITLRSLWPEDPLYPLTRRRNIRIIEIDGARPVDGALPGIALQEHAADLLARQPWMNINNLGRMADIIAADLVRLWPDEQQHVQSNLATLKQQLLQLSADSESQLAQLDNISVTSFTERADYLLRGLNLDVVETPLAENGNWSVEALAELSKHLHSQDIAVVVLDQQPDKDLRAAITAGGSRILVLAQGDDPVNTLKGAIRQVIQALSEGDSLAGS